MAQGEQFDVVCSLEVVEHVTDVKAFVQTLTPLVKPGGLLFMSTINRNPLAAALTVGMAEYVLRLVPPGTHDWRKFVQPEELSAILKEVCACGKDDQLVRSSGLTAFFELTYARRKDWLLRTRLASWASRSSAAGASTRTARRSTTSCALTRLNTKATDTFAKRQQAPSPNARCSIHNPSNLFTVTQVHESSSSSISSSGLPGSQ